MRSLLFFAMISASSFAFEKPSESVAVEPSNLPEIDYSKVKPIQQSKAAPSDEQVADTPVTPAPVRKSVVPGTPPQEGGEEKSNLPWLGVLGDPLSAPMKAQLGLEHGLVLRYVVPNSPAANAGLEVYDIIHSVNGQPVSNQLQLKKSIIAQMVDDCIKLDVRSKGEQSLVEVTLCDKPTAHDGERRVPSKKKHNDLMELQRLMDDDGREVAPPRERQNTGGIGRMFGKILKEITPDLDLNFEATNSVIIQDGNGSVQIQTINGSKSVIVKGAQNQVEFEGDWNTEEDFAQAPAHIKERIDKIGLRNIGRQIFLGEGR